MLRNKLWILSIVCMLLNPSFAAGADLNSSSSNPSSKGIEIFIFTDYFCPPCNSIEPYLEKALADLHQLGVKVTLVDKPISPLTPLYSKYYLYAARAANNFAETLHVRRLLFDIAKTRTVESESELIRQLKQNKVKIAIFDVKPVFDQWTDLIQQYAVRSTPTCVVVRPAQNVNTYTGSRNIPEAIDQLLKELSPTS